MDINQIITNMKTTDLFQPILLFALFLCGLTACNDSDEIRLSPFQETTVKGEASTLQIDLTRGDWRITSITTPMGRPHDGWQQAPTTGRYGKPAL